MIATYHNHSTWSDGKASIAELIARARELSVDELGISDHYVLHPRGVEMSWAMRADELDLYISEIESHRGLSGPVVRLGLEVDWFPGHGEAIREALRGRPFDYLIGSVHDVDGFVIDGSARAWEKLSAEERDEVHRRYWINMKSLVESGIFDIAAHLDLPKKFGYLPRKWPDREVNEALDALAEAGTIVELNTAGWHKPCADGYPSIDILKACRARGIAVTISADAHEPDHLLRDFPRAAQRLQNAGYEHIARFAKRRLTFEPIEAAIARF
jgi:histidinol-phosphatase (PHP family)